MMNSLSFQRCSLLRTDTAQSKIEGAVNKLCRERHEGLDDGTKNSDFPVEGEGFPLTSPFIERSKLHWPWLPPLPAIVRIDDLGCANMKTPQSGIR
jgi:hypothetical protein